MNSYSTWWQTLGVEQDATEKEIKKAYAKLIKQATQHEKHELMIEIQQAYTEAKQALSNRVQENYFNVENNTKSDMSEDKQSHIPTFLYSNSKSYLNEPTYEECESILSRVYNSYSKRSKIAEWHELFSSLTLQEETVVDKFASSFFRNHFCVNSAVLQYLNEKFTLYNENEVINNLLDYPLYDDYLNFQDITSLSYEQSEEFYKTWLTAYSLFIGCNYADVVKSCDLALAIYQHPYLYKLKLMSQYELELYDDCLKTCKIFNQYEIDNDGLRYQAKVLYQKQQYHRSLKLFKALAKKCKGSVLAARGKLKCYAASKRFISTFLAEFNYSYTADDYELNYKLASPLKRFMIKLGLKKAYNIIYAISRIALLLGALIGFVTAFAAGAVAFIVAIPFLIVGIIVYAFFGAIKETRAEKRAKNGQ